VELAANRWKMNKKDGKSVLLESESKKGFFVVEVHNSELEENLMAAKVCPVKIIQVKVLNK